MNNFIGGRRFNSTKKNRVQWEAFFGHGMYSTSKAA